MKVSFETKNRQTIIDHAYGWKTLKLFRGSIWSLKPGAPGYALATGYYPLDSVQ